MRSILALIACILIVPLAAQVFLPARRAITGVSAATNVPPPLDIITNPPWSAYSVARKLWSGWTGPAYIVYRTSDATTQHIGFTASGAVDTNSLVAFVGASHGYVNLLYDQSGNGRHMNTLSSPTNTIWLVTNGVPNVDQNNRPTSYQKPSVNNAFIKTAGGPSAVTNTFFAVITPINAFVTTDPLTVVNGGSYAQSALNLSNNLGTLTVWLDNDTAASSGVVQGPETPPYYQILATALFRSNNTEILQVNNSTAISGECGSLFVSHVAIGNDGGSPNAKAFFTELIWYDTQADTNSWSEISQNAIDYYEIENPPATTFSNPIAYWKMDESSDGSSAVTRVDSYLVGEAQNLTDASPFSASAPGLISNAVQFSSDSSESLSRSDSPDLSTGDIDYTIAGWFYLAEKGATNREMVMKFGGAGSLEYALHWNATTDRFQWFVSNNGSSTVSVTANTFGAPATNTWYFVASGHDAAANEIWISVNAGAQDTFSHSLGSFDSSATFTIGNRTPTANNPWSGMIDELGFWKKRLSGAELTTLYNGGSGITCCPFP